MAYYNDYSKLPSIPYKIIEKLAIENENLWKLIRWPEYDCLYKSNLSLDEKMSMIWKLQGKQDKYNIFLTDLVEDMQPKEKTILKVYSQYLVPKSNIEGLVLYEFDVLYGGKISMIDMDGIPVNRGDAVIHEILSTLNGKEVGGVGNIQFNTQKSSMSKGYQNLGNNKTYTGKSILMVVDVSDIGEVTCV